MGRNVVEKILQEHLVYGDITTGSRVGLKVDQVYTQDATGTMAWLQFEAIGAGRVKVPLAVSYVDHNMLQSNFMNADDHEFLRTAAARFGAWYSRPGNGISHQVHLERFSAPGRIALGTDSHTPTGGGIGMLAIGVGGLDAATVMAGAPLELKVPEVVEVRLTGRLKRPWVAAMDVILELLRRLTVKGGVGKIMEYGGPGLRQLSVPERATITNMGAELGATTSVFPSDERTLFFLKAQGREKDWVELKADPDAVYSDTITINLSELEPLMAAPHSPDNVVPVREMAGQKTKVDQVCIGSCTNSSYMVLKTVASALKGHTVRPGVNLLVNPGSRQVALMLARDGSMGDFLAAGARVLECSCGPCIGMGGSPGSAQVSVRTYNRNFRGRSGTKDAMVYLANPLLCVLFALNGQIIEPGSQPLDIKRVKEPASYPVDDNLLIPPREAGVEVEIKKGPNIKEVPLKGPVEDEIHAWALLVVGDNITTDDIMPAGSQILPLRSNIPAISEYVYRGVDPDFSKRAVMAKAKGGGAIIGGENYGQGSSREHAALAPMYLGVKVIIAKSFARIHRANLINFGILPLVFKDPADHDRISREDELVIINARAALEDAASQAGRTFTVEDRTKGFTFEAASGLSRREADLILAGGLLPYTREKFAGGSDG
ncbi:MAG: aconitate hydratase [Nitrospiraceae bacterium]|nr:aconitate hydratase [Nitrospiraceae bacterium]